MSTPPVNCFGSMNAHLYCVHVWSFAVEHVEVPVEIHDPIMAAHLSAMAQVQYAHSQAVVSQVFLHPFPRTCCLPYILHPLNFSGLNKWTRWHFLYMTFFVFYWRCKVCCLPSLNTSRTVERGLHCSRLCSRHPQNEGPFLWTLLSLSWKTQPNWNRFQNELPSNERRELLSLPIALFWCSNRRKYADYLK